MIFKKKINFYKGNSIFSIFGTIAVVSFSFFVTAGIILTSQNIGYLLNTFGENIQASVYLKPEATTENSNQIIKQILSENNIKKAQYIDSASAILKLSQQLDGLTQDLVQDPDLISAVPSSIEVTFKSENFNSDTIKNFANKFKNESLIEEITYGQQWLESYSNIVLGFKKLGLFFICFLLLACALVVSRSIRSAVLEKRNHIEVLELVGATRSFIRKPFIKEGFLIGFVSAIIAAGISYFSLQAVKTILSTQSVFQNTVNLLQFFNWPFLVSYIVMCTAFSGFISWWTVRQVNSGWLAVSAGERGVRSVFENFKSNQNLQESEFEYET